MWVKQCHKPPIVLGMVNIPFFTTYKNGDDWGMVYDIILPIIRMISSIPKEGRKVIYRYFGRIFYFPIFRACYNDVSTNENDHFATAIVCFSRF